MQTRQLISALRQPHFCAAALVEICATVRLQNTVVGTKVAYEILAVSAVADNVVAFGWTRFDQVAG
jgi:hypothetical protein